MHKVHSKGEGLFESLMRWIEGFLTLLRDGLGDPVSLEFLLPCGEEERMGIMREVDAIARYHYQLKVTHEAKLRRRFGRSAGQSDADAEDEEAAALVDGIVRDLSFGELISGDADDMAAQETDEDSSTEDDDDDDDDDDSEEDSSSEGSEESSPTSSTSESSEEVKLREKTPTPSLARSNTVGHTPTDPRSRSNTQRSFDVPTPTRQSTIPLMSPRSPSNSDSSRTPTYSRKSLPLVSRPSQNGKSKQQLTSAAAKAPSPSKKHKPQGPKPPELQHIPKLVPLFVEVVSSIFIWYLITVGHGR